MEFRYSNYNLFCLDLKIKMSEGTSVKNTYVYVVMKVYGS